MSTHHWQRLEDLYSDARLLDGGARAAFLDRACADDPALRRELEAMLAEAPPDRSLLVEQRFVVDARTGGVNEDAAAADPVIGSRIGAWRIVRRIGRGGMATVYLAEREAAQFQQQAAIKVGRPTLGEADGAVRFRLEQQILANLVHPHIARLLDGGVTPEGQPYIVMEYVEGQPLTTHGRERGLTIADRLRMFRIVCAAVQHAHRNLIVHRDLKPANILVSSGGEVKLLDFGIAKLLDPGAMGMTAVATRDDVRPMTLEYAAPEQLAGGPITTATDVHALGIVLYELLTGRRPYDAGTTTEVERRITRDTALPPSAAVRADPGTAALARQLRGDLDTIVLMALRKEPERRYASAGQLADDLDRYLAGRPVMAQRDTLAYRSRKFVARHRWGVAAAAAFLALLSGFSVVTALQARRLALERDVADGERVRAEQVLTALTEMFRVTDPTVTPAGAALPVAELLRQGEALTRREFGDRPDVRARLAHALGRIHSARSEYDKARALFEDALASQRALKGEDDPLTVEMAHDLAVLLAHMGETTRAAAMLEASLERHRKLYGPRHDRVAQAMQDLAQVVEQVDRKEPLYRGALAMRQALHPGDDPDVAWAMSQLAGNLLIARKIAEAVPLEREAVAMLERTVGERHPRYLSALGTLAQVLNQANFLEESEQVTRKALDREREVFGTQSYQVADSLNNLGVNQVTRGRYAEAVTPLAESYAVHTAVFGEGHWRTANTARNLGRAFELQQRYADALAWLTRAAALYERSEGRVGQNTYYIRAQAALVMLRLDRSAEAERALRAALAGLGAEGSRTPDTRLADVRLWLGRALVERQQPKDAEPLLRASIDFRDRALGAAHPRAAEARCELARALAGQGRREEARAVLESCWSIYEKWGLADPVVAASLKPLR